MKAVVFEKPGSLAVKEVPYPTPERGEVTIKVTTCCICGTDIHILGGEFGGVVYPMIPGHEFSGTVAEVGPGVADPKPGDRVSVTPAIWCTYCYHCKAGKFNHCLNGFIVGHSKSTPEMRLDGGFAEYVTVPQRNVFKLPDGVSWEAGAFLPNFSTVVNALRRARLASGEQVLIYGAGTMGNLFVQLAKVSGASPVVVSDMSESRLKMAKELGADLALTPEELESQARKIAPYGFDLVVDAVGSPRVVEKGIDLVKSGERLLLFGASPIGQKASLETFQIYRRDLHLIGSISAVGVSNIALDLIATGQIKIEPLVSHKFPIDQFAEAVEVARDPKKSTRVLVYP